MWKFLDHTVNLPVFLSHCKFICFNITLCNRLLKYQNFVGALVKYKYFVFEAVNNTFYPFYNLFYHTYESLVVNLSRILSRSCLCIILSVLSNLFQLRYSPDQNLAILCVFNCVHPPGAYHIYSCCLLHNITRTSVSHLLLPFCVHLTPCRYKLSCLRRNVTP